MTKFNLNIMLIKPNNQAGTQFQFVVEAENYVDAMDKGKMQLVQELKESGLVIDSTPKSPENASLWPRLPS